MTVLDRVGAPSTTTITIYCAGVSVPVFVNARGETICAGCGARVKVVT